jgi:hypothetical protein
MGAPGAECVRDHPTAIKTVWMSSSLSKGRADDAECPATVPDYYTHEYHTAYLIYPTFSTFKVLKLITHITFTLNILQVMTSFIQDALDLGCSVCLLCNLGHI